MSTTKPKQPVTPVPIRECPQCGYKTYIRNEDDEFDLIVQDNAEKALEIDDLKEQVSELVAAIQNLINVKGRHHTEQAYKQLEVLLAKVKQS